MKYLQHVPAPRARLTTEEFLRVDHECANAPDVAARLGISVNSVLCRRRRLRLRGIPLRHRRSGRPATTTEAAR